MKILGICYVNNISRFDVLPHQIDIFSINKKIDNKVLFYKNYSNTTFYYTFKNARLNVFTKFIHGLMITARMLSLVKKYDCFIFITPPYFHFLAYFITYIYRRKTINIVADAYYHITKDKNFDNYFLYIIRRILSPIYLLIEYISTKYSSAVFTNSFFLYQIHKKWNKNTKYSSNGADIKTITQSKRINYCKEDYIIYIGSFSPFRGMNLLIEAFKLLKEQYKKPLKLIIMGKYGSQEKQIKSLIGNNQDIILPGFFPIPKLYSYVKGAKIGVITNYDTITSRTISSNKGFIYIGADVPQIVTDSGDHSYWTKKLNTGLIVKPSPQAICDGLLKLINNTKLHEKFKNNCKLKKKFVDYDFVKLYLINYMKHLNQ